MNAPNHSLQAALGAKIAIKKANRTIKAAKLIISESRAPEIELSTIRGSIAPTLQDKLTSIK